jgi:hypothetical protein
MQRVHHANSPWSASATAASADERFDGWKQYNLPTGSENSRSGVGSKHRTSRSHNHPERSEPTTRWSQTWIASLKALCVLKFRNKVRNILPINKTNMHLPIPFFEQHTTNISHRPTGCHSSCLHSSSRPSIDVCGSGCPRS